MTSMAVLWDDPEAAKLRVLIDADIVRLEENLSALQNHMLALKVMSKALARTRVEELARIVEIDDRAERTEKLALVVAPELRGAPAGDRGRNWDNK